MIAQNTNQQAGRKIKSDAHQKACVKSQDPAAYNAEREENIIREALNILVRRMRQAEAIFNSPSTVRDYLKLKMAELEAEVFGGNVPWYPDPDQRLSARGGKACPFSQCRCRHFCT